MLRIFSWNVNGIRACGTKGLFDWLSAESPDMLCLQETKAQVDQMPKEFMAPSFSAPASSLHSPGTGQKMPECFPDNNSESAAE